MRYRLLLPFAGEVRPLLMVSVYTCSCCIESRQMEEGKIAQKALTLSTAQAKAE